MNICENMMSKKNLILFTLFAINLVDQPAPEIKIQQGILSGKISKDGSLFEYVGIPYASTNRFNRFQAPLPPPTWSGVYKAVDEHYQCAQWANGRVMGEEDCLKINVYVPAKAKKPLPVMVYIHGGAFVVGNGGKLMYGADFIVKHDVILVTFNYRLGAFGFLCLGIKEAPGNAGLKDQLAALRWVKNNIAAFGGDPDNITLFGESAGATSVSLLLASKTTEGLFHRAIVQSGSGLTNWAINQNPLQIARVVAKELGYSAKEPLEIYKFLSKLPYEELAAYVDKHPITRLLLEDLMLLPCVEKEIPNEEAILTDLPYNLLTKNPKNISVIYGTTDREGLFIISEETKTTLAEWNTRSMLASDLTFKSEDEKKKVENEVRKFYFGSEPVSNKTQMNLSKLQGDLFFEIPVIFEAELLVNSINAPIYNYYFQYDGGRNMVKHHTGFTDEPGACHGDDILYLFNALVWPYRIKQEDQLMIDGMTKMFTNFAKYGNPTPDGDTDLPVKWLPSTRENMNFMYINNVLKVGPLPNPASYGLWKNIYDKYHSTNLNGVK